MKVEYTLTPEDSAAQLRDHSNTIFGKSRPWLLYFLAGILSLNLLAQVLISAKVVPWPIVAGFALFPIAIFVALFFRHRLTAHFLRRAGTQPTIMSLEVRPEGLALTTPTRASLTIWQGIDRIVVTKTHAFFYLNKAAALIVPCRAFDDKREFERFVDMARSYQEAARVTSEAQQPE